MFIKILKFLSIFIDIDFVNYEKRRIVKYRV